DAQVRIEASKALSNMDPASAEAMPELIQALEDEVPLVRINAIRTMIRLGEESKPAVPALIKALGAKENDTNAGAFHFTGRELAARGLGRGGAGSPEPVPALRKALREADTKLMRQFAVRALGDVGPPARAAVPEIRALLDDEEEHEDVKNAAREALE